MVDKSEHSNQLVVNETDVDADPEDVFALLVDEEGRASWLEPDPERTIQVQSADPPCAGDSGRISWWWWSGTEAPRHVELWVIARPGGSRVIAIESAPTFGLTLLAARCARRPAAVGA